MVEPLLDAACARARRQGGASMPASQLTRFVTHRSRAAARPRSRRLPRGLAGSRRGAPRPRAPLARGGLGACAALVLLLALSLPASADIQSEIGGRVSVDVNGDGKASHGEPGLAGVTITLHGEDGDQSTVTDGDGNYHFGGLQDGVYTVTIVAPGGYGLLTGASAELQVHRGSYEKGPTFLLRPPPTPTPTPAPSPTPTVVVAPTAQPGQSRSPASAGGTPGPDGTTAGIAPEDASAAESGASPSGQARGNNGDVAASAPGRPASSAPNGRVASPGETSGDFAPERNPGDSAAAAPPEPTPAPP